MENAEKRTEQVIFLFHIGKLRFEAKHSENERANQSEIRSGRINKIRAQCKEKQINGLIKRIKNSEG